MALTLSTSGITNSGTIQAAHISQSIDALKGTHAYNLTPSGSINLTGSMNYRYKTELIAIEGTDLRTVSLSTYSSGTTFIITNVNNTNSSSNLRFDIPAATSTVAGTHFKILISQIGADSTVGVGCDKPFLFKTSDPYLMPRIIDGAGGSTANLFTTNDPVDEITIANGRYVSGDNFEAICDGIYWYITGHKRVNGGISA